MGLWISTPPRSSRVFACCRAFISTVQVVVPKVLMMNCGVMFGEVVSEIVRARGPVHMVLALVYPVLKPIKSHIDGFGFPLFDFLICKTDRGGIIELDGCGWLGVTHLTEGLSELGGVFGVGKYACDFSFGGGAEDMPEDFRFDQDGRIGGFRFRWFVPKVEESAGATASLGFG